MHAANKYLLESVYVGGAPQSCQLTSRQASLLGEALKKDASSYLYSGAISLSECISGVENKSYTWATVKSYYSVFYFLRSIMAVAGVAIFYIGKTPYVVSANPGEIALKKKGNTHELVISEFRARFSSHWLLSQVIDSMDPLGWIKSKRECANYGLGRFVEPITPIHLEKIVKQGARRSINSYLDPSNDYLAFDPDHAILSYPIHVMRHALKGVKSVFGSSSLSEDEIRIISYHCHDRHGVINEFYKLFK